MEDKNLSNKDYLFSYERQWGAFDMTRLVMVNDTNILHVRTPYAKLSWNHNTVSIIEFTHQ